MRVLLALLAAVACTAEPPGAAIFRDPNLSTGPVNHFSCATCHTVGESSTQILAGYDLRNAVHRPSWWGGYETRILDAMNYCLTEFMGGAALAETDPRAKQLYEYLAVESPDDPAPALPLTVVKQTTDLAGLAATSDAARGKATYNRACVQCHGQPHTGAGKLAPFVSTIPDDTYKNFPPYQVRAVVVEKIRHGRFFNIGGLMPLYSMEAMTDAEIGDILAYLGL